MKYVILCISVFLISCATTILAVDPQLSSTWIKDMGKGVVQINSCTDKDPSGKCISWSSTYIRGIYLVECGEANPDGTCKRWDDI